MSGLLLGYSGAHARSGKHRSWLGAPTIQWMMPNQNRTTAATTITTIQPKTPMNPAAAGHVKGGTQFDFSPNHARARKRGLGVSYPMCTCSLRSTASAGEVATWSWSTISSQPSRRAYNLRAVHDRNIASRVIEPRFD
jgi:hypothetical protein